MKVLVVISLLLMSILSDLPSAKDVQDRVKKRYDKLFFADGEKRLPYVCVACDKFIVSDDDRCHLTVEKLQAARDVLHWSTYPDERRTSDIEEHFQ